MTSRKARSACPSRMKSMTSHEEGDMKSAENKICCETVTYMGEAGDVPDGAGSRTETPGDVSSLIDHLTLIHIDVESNDPGLHSQENQACCSRNVMRKQKHWEKIIAAKKSKRRQEKERRKARQCEDANAGTDCHQHSKKFLKALTKERLLGAKDAGPRLCIDLSMTDHMSKKEMCRLAAQIRRLYGSNKKAAKPFWLYLTDQHLKGLSQDLSVSAIQSTVIPQDTMASEYNIFNIQWPFLTIVETTEASFLDLFALETIVYLTPDSDHVLEDIDPTKVYILGGLVDESVQKKVTYQKAKHNGLQTARLPIQEYMVKKVNVKNFHSEILAINQVFDILRTYSETQSWPEALKAGVSPGKGFVLPGEIIPEKESSFT
ncbi:tRNA methyltransferase 10 homolog B isoform X2 [Bufo gargarizans]|uniref:tRNA methyltransferase 10 homolog B isoform X2 n=1 Tax=Bufo gargarizans TaxID=30331 RepID=UPI001CF2113D|nr:tRNA methyltransferase 10 homolog B isoform X2 [Bufo gargarizans]